MQCEGCVYRGHKFESPFPVAKSLRLFGLALGRFSGAGAGGQWCVSGTGAISPQPVVGALYALQGTQKENSTAGRSRHVAVNGSGRIPRDEITAAAYSMLPALFLVAMHFAKPML